tara:strand:+ start:493 stop:1122 length:630 start_codon:yes stop_codon:yes gene_type:complete
MKTILLIGGGGHCKSCIDIIESTKNFKIIGIIDKKEKLNTSILNYPIIGTDENILDFANQVDYFFITLGKVSQSPKRKELFIFLEKNKLNIPTIISPSALVSNHAVIQSGTIIMHHAIINANAHIGKNCIINSKALIEHDTTIDSHSHISTGTIINGNVVVHEHCFIGSNSTVNLDVTIHKNSIIASQSLVTKSLTKPGNYRGIPVDKF